MVSTSEEDWSIISSSDMDDHSTTSSVRYDDESLPGATTPGSNSDNDRIDSTIEISPVSPATIDQPAQITPQPVACKSRSVLNLAYDIDRFFRRRSEHWYDIYLNDYITNLKEDIETPSLRYKVETWQKFSSSSSNEPLFKLRKQNLYIHDRIAYEIITFLQSNKSFLLYYVMGVVGGFVTLSYFSLNYLFSTKVVEKPKSLTTQIEQYFSTLFTQQPPKKVGVMSYFKRSGPSSPSRSTGELLKRFKSYLTVKSSQLNDLWSVGTWQLSKYARRVNHRFHDFLSQGQHSSRWLSDQGKHYFGVCSAEIKQQSFVAAAATRNVSSRIFQYAKRQYPVAVASTRDVSSSIVQFAKQRYPVAVAATRDVSNSIVNFAKQQYTPAIAATKLASSNALEYVKQQYHQSTELYYQYSQDFAHWLLLLDAETEMRRKQNAEQWAKVYNESVKPLAKLYKNKFDKFAFTIYKGWEPLLHTVKDTLNVPTTY